MKMVLFIISAIAIVLLLIKQHDQNEDLRRAVDQLANRIPDDTSPRTTAPPLPRPSATTPASASPPFLPPSITSIFRQTPTPVPVIPASGRRKVECHQCRGEGSVMVRRTAIQFNGMTRGTVSDSKTMCGLCMGKGLRALEIPSGSWLCPDCKGMGKRAVINTGNAESGGLEGARLQNSVAREFWSHAPTSTGCIRCLGKGHIGRPSGN